MQAAARPIGMRFPARLERISCMCYTNPEPTTEGGNWECNS